MLPSTQTRRPAWQIAASIKLSQLQTDAQALRDAATAAREQTVSLHNKIVKLTDRQKELVLARSNCKADNDLAALQIANELADVAAELDALQAGLQAARGRYNAAQEAAGVANALAQAAAKAFATVSHVAGNANGGFIPGQSAAGISGVI